MLKNIGDLNMALVGFKAKNHPQQKANPLVDDRALPHSEFLNRIDVVHVAEMELGYDRQFEANHAGE
jgi:hypothetical protein